MKRFQVNYDFFSFKVTNIEEIQSAIVGLASVEKEWEINNQENILINLESSQDEKVFK